jgi:hydrogenase maturation protein HypF
MDRAAFDVRVTGVVQGVGFRPFVHRLAARHGLAGWIRNAAGDVQIAVEGAPGALEEFLRALEREAPPLARIERVITEPHAPTGLDDFRIQASADAPDQRQPVSPDVATCARCAAELFDPGDRRFRYPFITCTDCGPRFTVIAAMPYDRERTSMAAFRQCPECLREYTTPGDRRYHSETNSCPVCGPQLWYVASGGGRMDEDADAALVRAARLLLSGGILALRGLGGFHLAVDATNEAAVARLRARKRRDAKPLGLMVRTLDEACAIGIVGLEEAPLLARPERPLVLLERLPGARLADGIAPGLAWIGVMLAYTPVHHLLCEAVGRPLVMTSGNLSEEPIATGIDEAYERLGGIADGFLFHDREIVARYDDSLVRPTPAGPIFLRRARGYAPLPLELPIASPEPLLAVCPHLKNTFTLVHGRRAFVSQHIGDLENLETLQHFHDALERFQALFRVRPALAVRDLHPGYLSTRIADELGVPRVIPVQHHHAHIAAVLAEHGETGPALGVAYDGTGYGDDGHTWGAEVLLADLQGYRRIAHLRYAPLPGGDLAARTPWRAALGYLSLDPHLASAFELAFEGIDPREREVAERQITRGVNAPVASSMGRLFDAAAAVLGLRRVSAYEGQAAMELESLAGRRVASEIRWGLERDDDGVMRLDPLHLLATLGMRRQRGENVADLAADFHASVAWATVEVLRRAVEETGVTTVALGGGVFQNARLLGSVRARCEAIGIRTLVPRLLSPNDGAVSYGQAAIAAARLAAERAA